MASLGKTVWRVAAAAVRPPLPALCRPSGRTYSAKPTSEKSVPYEETLKQSDGSSSGPTKPLPRSAEVVVIGGGSLGCQTVYHLAKMGITNVVLLERDRLTAGTTWHTAGLLWQLRPSDVEVELLAHTRNVISKDLEEETGLHTGWIQNGGLFIASNKQRLDEYKRLMSVSSNSLTVMKKGTASSEVFDHHSERTFMHRITSTESKCIELHSSLLWNLDLSSINLWIFRETSRHPVGFVLCDLCHESQQVGQAFDPDVGSAIREAALKNSH